MKKTWKYLLFLFLAAAVLMGTPSVKAASRKTVAELSYKSFRKEDARNKAETASEARWKKTSSGYQYLRANGKPYKASKGKILLFTVKGKTYAVDDTGIQLHGWRECGGKYHYFSFGSGKKGYMLTDTKVDGIPLDADGRAKPSTARTKKQVVLMASYSRWADEITASKAGASKEEKLRIVFDYLRKLPYRYVSGYKKNDSDWDIWGAEYVYTHRSYDCHPIAAAFAYMAHAIGYQDIQVITLKYWHSFTRIDGLYYDTSLARHDLNQKGDKYYRKFAMKNYYSRSAKIIKNIFQK